MSHTPCIQMQTVCYLCSAPLGFIPPRICEPAMCRKCAEEAERVLLKPEKDNSWTIPPDEGERMLNNQWPRKVDSDEV